MRMRRRTRILALLAVLPLLGLLPARAEPREGFHLEARVPASTLAIASFEDVGSWERRFMATAMGQILADAEMQAFMKPVIEAVHEQLGQGVIPQIPPIVLEALVQMQGLDGQLAIALVDLDLRKKKIGLVASLDFGDAVADFVSFLGRLQKEVDPSGQRVKTEERNGKTWWSVELDRHVRVTATTVDTAFVLATDAKLLEDVVAGGAADPLSKAGDYAKVRERCGSEEMGAFVYVNAAAALAKFGDEIPPQAHAIAMALGLDTVHSIAYSMAFQGDGFRDTLLIHAPGADHGLIPLIDMKPLSAPRTLDLAPSGTFFWGEANLPLSDMIARIRKLAAQVDPSAPAQLDQGLEQAKMMLGVDVEQEVMAGLTGFYGLYAAFPPTGGLFPEVALVLEVKDPAAYEGVFERLANGVAGLLNEQGKVIAGTRSMDYHGIRMHIFDMQKARGSKPIPFMPTWAVIGNRLVITLVPHAMKEIVLRAQGRTATPGLATKEDFRALMALKPDRAGAMEYFNLKGALSVLYDTGVPLLQTLLKPNVMKKCPIPLDWALLPPASRVVPHFRSMAEYVTWDGDGIEVNVQGPVPMLPLVAMAAGAVTFLSMGRQSEMMIQVETAMDEAEADAVRVARGTPVVPPAPVRAPKPEPVKDLDADLDLELAKVLADMLVDTMNDFRKKNDGRLPKSLDELVKEGLIGSVPADPWDTPFRLRTGDGALTVESAGPDKRFGTPDDVRATRK